MQMKSFAELLDKVDAFHDLNVSFCDFEEKAFHLIIEDHSEGRKPTNLSGVPTAAHIWANELSDFALSLDVAMPTVLYEVVEPESGKLEIYMNNGQIFIEAEDIEIQLCE